MDSILQVRLAQSVDHLKEQEAQRATYHAPEYNVPRV